MGAGGGLYEPVLELAAAELQGEDAIKVAAVAGPLQAEAAAGAGYDAALVDVDAPAALARVPAIAANLPVIVRARGVLPASFWHACLEISGLAAVVMAAPGQWQSAAMLRAVAEAGRAGDVAVYGGSEDRIVTDLLTVWRPGGAEVRVAGGLLGFWAVWTLRAVRLLEQVRDLAAGERPIARSWLTLGAEIADSAAAVCDAASGYAGRAAGVAEVPGAAGGEPLPRLSHFGELRRPGRTIFGLSATTTIRKRP